MFCLLNLPIPREVIAAVRDSEALEHYSNTYYADKLFKMAGVFFMIWRQFCRRAWTIRLIEKNINILLDRCLFRFVKIVVCIKFAGG